MTVTATKRAGTAARAVTYVWIGLCAITVGSWWLGPGHSGGSTAASIPITVAVVALGYLKCRLIIRHFMEVRTGPARLRHATDAWLAALWLAVLALYLVGVLAETGH
ncbi:cytochrome C oxidase subunit IV family protein [Nocardia mexicana]|uniref:Cytochrome c oxidase subunit IV n=1 Tax=Nocardia mexicana TaxID=279262 RepID=A0A370GMT8_9NOCA|nr:cytochrome C oxidase subunit IV family protein [Nocardia mexicana]RDI45042.1 cytochrome c oxidase subunit IV [Nocardia mexicana]